MSTSKLMKVTYYDPKSQIRLLCYADTVVWDTKPTPTLTALRFGGYPERVQGLADAIYGGATIEIEDGKDTYSLKTLTRQYRRELSHDGVYAEAITRDEAVTRLGRLDYLSGIARSAFHFTAMRITEDGKVILFDSSRLFGKE